ncbi:MAG: carboxypeptidase regulatory-like domain-containing protein [Sedimentisphaerales bacterium]|nr:carboxypeptidase regulatory-like domain-containing protein [Sedimentisphaerales bacterium]
MNILNKKIGLIIIFCISVLFAQVGFSLVIVGGAGPMHQFGSFNGALEVANLPTRYGWWEGPPFGGGEYHFLYRCENTNQFNQALKLFAAIENGELELALHNGPGKDYVIQEGRLDWSFMTWVPSSWNSLNNSSREIYYPDGSETTKPVPVAKKIMPVPRIDLYLSKENPIVWKDVIVPENVKVIDLRPGSIDKKFEGKGLVRGKVIDIETKKPLANARVTLYRRFEDTENNGSIQWNEYKQVSTDSKGLCRIAQIPLGYYQITAAADGYVELDLDVFNNTIAECYDFEIALAKPYTISGIVVDETGKPVKGIGIIADDFLGPDGNEYNLKADNPVLTDENGKFEIPDLPQGFASLRCRTEDLHQADSIFLRHQIPSTKEIKLTVTGTGIVRGKVLDKNGKIPSGEVHVQICPPGEQIGKWGGSMRLKEDGTFEFKGVPPGEYYVGTDVMLTIEGDTTNATPVKVEAGKVYELEIIHKK